MGLENGSKSDQTSSLQPIKTEHNADADDPILDRSVSCFSVATSPSPLSSPTSHDVSGHHTPQWSMISSSPQFGLNAQLSFPEHHYPDVDRDCSDASPAGYDPNRIPASIFSSKPSAPGHWSAASNESLFSICMGNKSFANAEELADCERKSEASRVQENDSGAADSEVSPSASNVQNNGAEVPETKQISASLNSARLSNGSANSCKSFAFPVLVKDTSRNPGSHQKSESQSQLAAEPPPETPKESPKAAATPESGCFTCFSCFPRCC